MNPTTLPLISFAIGAVLASAGAAAAGQHFTCGDATVTIAIVARDSKAWEDRAESVVTVARQDVSTVLRYRHIDFIGGQCVAPANAVPLVVFQAYCGGSGCKDRANWGVIDSANLRVLAVPRDDNRDATRALLGDAALPTLPMLSVFTEAKAQGIAVP